MSKIISIHSFRGGTGKSNSTANLAALLALAGQRVGVIDTDQPPQLMKSTTNNRGQITPKGKSRTPEQNGPHPLSPLPIIGEGEFSLIFSRFLLFSLVFGEAPLSYYWERGVGGVRAVSGVRVVPLGQITYSVLPAWRDTPCQVEITFERMLR